ncbi:MAG TPA: hypothetical protein PK466_08920 [Thermotogota bacterium]|nr:hypothetical protein [Thermotogota bacterium]HPJ89269.1 hypothetical protein [Thermotogota bacterium]HPR96439.1 hypothetical protein [Thermotogota bacterium]
MPDEKKDKKKQEEKIISRNINYRSRSPEKLLDELKEKNKRLGYTKNRDRKRGFLFTAFGAIFIALFALVWLIFGGGNDVISSTYIKRLDPFVFKILSADETEYGDENIIKVKVSNITGSVSAFQFKDFRFSIVSDKGQEVYAFSYPADLNVSMNEYDSRDVFDFQRENPDFDIHPGTYTIHSDFYVDDKYVTLKKTMIIHENVDMTIRLFNDYALPGQTLPVYLSIVNHSPEVQNFNLGTYRVSLKDGSTVKSEIFKNSDVIRDIVLKPGEKLDLILGELTFPVDQGTYTLDISYFMNDELNEDEYKVAVHEINSESSSHMIRILPYTLKSVGVGQSYTAEINLANDTQGDLYERVKGFIFEIGMNGTVLYRYTEYQEGTINIIIPAFSKRKVFDSTEWKQIEFQQTGTYKVSIRTILENDILEYSEDLRVE